MSTTINSKTMATPTPTPTPVIKPLLLLAVLLSLPPLVMAVTPGWVGETDAVVCRAKLEAVISMAVLVVIAVLVAVISMTVRDPMIFMAVLVAVVSMAVLIAIEIDIDIVFLLTDEVVVIDIGVGIEGAVDHYT